jgi:tetratricopeptide (TPR) repeat protein
MKCLEKDRNRRYETANGLSIDLLHYLKDETVMACPPSAAYRLRKFARRNKVQLSVATLVLFPLLLLGGGIVWTARDRALRQAALEQGVTAALADVEHWHQRENWPEALGAIKRAEGLLGAGDPMPEFSARIAQWRRQLESVVRLEQLRIRDSVLILGMSHDQSALHTDYQSEFRSLDIDIDAMPAKEAAAHLRALPIRDQLIAALDTWASLRMFLIETKGKAARDQPDEWWARPLHVALAADTDEFGNRVRRAAENFRDQKTLLELAQSPDVLRLPAPTLDLLQSRLNPRTKVELDAQIELLKRVQRARPDDFFVNHMLAIRRPDQTRSIQWSKSGPRTNGLFLGDEAVPYARVAVALRPNDGYVRGALAQALFEANRLDEALAAYREAARLEPDFFAAHGNIAVILQEQGKLHEALAVVTEMINRQPGEGDNYFHLADIFYELHDLDKAVVAYRKAIELTPDDAWAYNNLGNVLEDQEKHSDAVTAYRKAIELQPDQFEMYSNLGSALVEQGRYEEAVAACQKSIDLQPSVEAYWYLGAALEGQGKLDEVAVAYRKATELTPTDYRIHFSLATVLAQLGKSEEAVKTYRKVIELAPTDAEAINELAWLLATATDVAVRDPVDAVKQAIRAVELAPTEGDYWNTLGIARYRAGKWQPALEALNKSIDLRAGGDALDWYFLAMAHWQLGHKDVSRKWYDRAAEWTNKTAADDDDLRRFRAEAAELLGITEDRNRKPSTLNPQP